MSRLSEYAEKRSSRFMQKKLAFIGLKLGFAGCGGLAYYFPIFSDGNIMADGAVYFIMLSVAGFIWWEFCRKLINLPFYFPSDETLLEDLQLMLLTIFQGRTARLYF